jgi:hypothetical protein
VALSVVARWSGSQSSRWEKTFQRPVCIRSSISKMPPSTLTEPPRRLALRHDDAPLPRPANGGGWSRRIVYDNRGIV